MASYPNLVSSFNSSGDQVTNFSEEVTKSQKISWAYEVSKNPEGYTRSEIDLAIRTLSGPVRSKEVRSGREQAKIRKNRKKQRQNKKRG
jgi:hypothetical protein